MALKDIIQEIRKLSTADQYRLKEVLERKHKDRFTCSHCHYNNAVRFGKYNVKMGSGILEHQRYRAARIVERRLLM